MHGELDIRGPEIVLRGVGRAEQDAHGVVGPEGVVSFFVVKEGRVGEVAGDRFVDGRVVGVRGLPVFVALLAPAAGEADGEHGGDEGGEEDGDDCDHEAAGFGGAEVV